MAWHGMAWHERVRTCKPNEPVLLVIETCGFDVVRAERDNERVVAAVNSAPGEGQ
jgi:hypothetical protein